MVILLHDFETEPIFLNLVRFVDLEWQVNDLGQMPMLISVRWIVHEVLRYIGRPKLLPKPAEVFAVPLHNRVSFIAV